MLPRAKSFYQGLNGLKDVKTTIITGKNRDLYQRIHGRYENIEVVGYTDQVYRYMQEADLVISKPGGITLFETIFSELPILVFSPYLSTTDSADHLVACPPRSSQRHLCS